MEASYRPVSLLMPDALPDARQPTPCGAGQPRLFGDQRPGAWRHPDGRHSDRRRGHPDNKTSRSHTADESRTDSLLGYETKIDNIFNPNADPGSLVDGSAERTTADGSSSARRKSTCASPQSSRRSSQRQSCHSGS
jgi:hypothetical protein